MQGWPASSKFISHRLNRSCIVRKIYSWTCYLLRAAVEVVSVIGLCWATWEGCLSNSGAPHKTGGGPPPQNHSGNTGCGQSAAGLLMGSYCLTVDCSTMWASGSTGIHWWLHRGRGLGTRSSVWRILEIPSTPSSSVGPELVTSMSHGPRARV